MLNLALKVCRGIVARNLMLMRLGFRLMFIRLMFTMLITVRNIRLMLVLRVYVVLNLKVFRRCRGVRCRILTVCIMMLAILCIKMCYVCWKLVRYWVFWCCVILVVIRRRVC